MLRHKTLPEPDIEPDTSRAAAPKALCEAMICRTEFSREHLTRRI